MRIEFSDTDNEWKPVQPPSPSDYAHWLHFKTYTEYLAERETKLKDFITDERGKDRICVIIHDYVYRDDQVNVADLMRDITETATRYSELPYRCIDFLCHSENIYLFLHRGLVAVL